MRQDRAYGPVNTLIPGARGHQSAPNDVLRQPQQKTDPEAYPPLSPSHRTNPSMELTPPAGDAGNPRTRITDKQLTLSYLDSKKATS